MFKLFAWLFRRKASATPSTLPRNTVARTAPSAPPASPTPIRRGSSPRLTTATERRTTDDVISSPLHPLNPLNSTIYSHSDTPSRSHCSDHSSSDSYSSSSDSSSCSSSDSSSSSSSSD